MTNKEGTVKSDKAQGKRSASRYWLVIVALLAVGIGYTSKYEELSHYIEYQYLILSANSSLLGENLNERISTNRLNSLEKNRWSDSVTLSFPNAKPVPEKNWEPFNTDFADQLMTEEKPYVLKNTPVKNWPAISKWNGDYITRVLPTVKVHAPSHPVVRMHQADETHPFGQQPGVKWTRPWKQETVLTKVFYDANKLMYFMLPGQMLPSEMQQDVYVSPFTVAWSPPMEVNLWMGTPTVTTPAHYDFVHNFYAQVHGKKRFILFPPEDADSLYLFTNLHPSARQSQVNFNALNSTDIFPEFPSKLHPLEVILKPGDVLYIPPFWFHYVCVVGEEVSMSISTHTESHQAQLHERIWTRSSEFKRMFFDKYRSTKELKTLPGQIQFIEAYIMRLYGGDKKFALESLKRIVDHRWSHFEYDREAVGLAKLIQESRQSFPTLEQIKQDFSLTKEQIKRINNAGDDIGGLLAQFKGGVKDIMLANHIESFAAHVVGGLNVDPLLRYMITAIEKEIKV